MSRNSVLIPVINSFILKIKKLIYIDAIPAYFDAYVYFFNIFCIKFPI
jgi:hypothetical protein